MENLQRAYETVFLRPLLALGIDSPLKRFIVLGATFVSVTYLMKPSLFFTADGKMKPWSMISDSPDATPVPFFVVPLLVAGFFALL